LLLNTNRDNETQYIITLKLDIGGNTNDMFGYKEKMRREKENEKRERCERE
jgi:hypothetical protein